MDYLAFTIRRLFYSIFVFIGLSILIFLIARVLPGDPARLALGPRAPKEVVEKLREQLHLNDPLPIQYYHWFTGVLHGDFGKSLHSWRPVIKDIKEYLPATLELAFFSFCIMSIGGILAGVLAAALKDRWADNTIRLFSYTGVAIPEFVWGILLVLIFSHLLGIFPITERLSFGVSPPPLKTGFFTIDALLSGDFKTFFNALKHIILPAISLAMLPLAQAARLTRITMIDNMRKDFMEAARAYGIPSRVIWSRLLLKPSLIPAISLLPLSFASLVTRAFLIELIFRWPGLARFGMEAIFHNDVNAVVAVVLVMGILFVTANLVVDLIIGFLDPRIRVRALEQ